MRLGSRECCRQPACAEEYRITSLIRNSTSPYEHHRALGINMLWGPRRSDFLMSEAPLYITFK